MSIDFFLVCRIRNGDDKAAEIIIRKYYKKVFDYCKYHSEDIYTAEDLTQEVFLIFLKKIDQYEHRGKLLNYLYTIARNKCIDERKKESYKDVSIECIAHEISSSFIESERTIESLYVRQAVEKLPSDIREVIIMYYFLDMKQREIADICDISLELVKYRLKKGKEMIKKYIGGEI
ncbi:RNA polymerase sigma factor [Facklamia hominis]|uniref:RNA polymerase sigma factor n=1 Tax=Facklamia hominis TaxID=178214 RepID=UPI0029D41C95|nr:RNA polymerase sigma factor [Facklamia hominis]WPJ90669.1 RNA polymerase sigma factor [Facklamia hominis]